MIQARALTPHIFNARAPVNITSVSVSGISGGGFFATQVHVAFSKSVTGVGVIAGGPFFCAQGQLDIALSSCMKGEPAIPIEVNIGETSEMALAGLIDDPRHMSNHRVYLFSGTKDTVVRQSVMTSTLEYYSHYVDTSGQSIRAVFDVPAEHAMITFNYGNDCSYLGSPYINHCSPQISVAEELLLHLHPGFKKGYAQFNESNLFEFDQTKFVSSGNGFAKKGYMYVPTACQAQVAAPGTKCSIHVNFHGCLQGYYFVNTTYVANAGFNNVAEANNVIVIYPQIEPTNFPFNPKGCFDWWGYTTFFDPIYASKRGPQMTAVKEILKYFGATTFE